MVTRRKFLASTAAAAASYSFPCHRAWSDEPALEKTINRARRALRISDIKVKEILLPFHSYNALNLQRYHGSGIQARSVYSVQTTAGFEGIGENWGRPICRKRRSPNTSIRTPLTGSATRLVYR